MPVSPKKSLRTSSVTQSAPKKAEVKPMVTVEEYFNKEDQTASNLSWETIESSFSVELRALKEILTEILNEQNEETRVALVSKNGESALLSLIAMRRLNRLAQFRNHLSREDVSRERCTIDEQFLQLQNAHSEIEHVWKEVNRCLEFSSADEDIDLVSVEEFYSKAPESVSKPQITKSDQHEQRLARLTWEMLERKNLVALLQEREGRKGVLLSDIATKTHRLKSLKPHLSSIIEATRPLQELMGLSTEDFRQQSHLFAYLPKELAVISVQAEAYRDIARDHDVNVRCEGDLESAIKLQEIAGPICSDVVESDDTRSDTEGDGSVSPARSLRRRRSTVSEQIERKRDALLCPHPIHLVIEISCQCEIKVYLTLQWIPQLRSISAISRLDGKNVPFHGNLLCNDSLLVELFDGDSGVCCPDVVGQAKLDQLKITIGDYDKKIGRMYKFVQKMAGISSPFLNGSKLSDEVQSVIEEIRNRVRSRCSLIKQIQSFESLKPSTEEMKQFDILPVSITSKLVSFSVISAEDFYSNEMVTAEYEQIIKKECEATADSCFYFSTAIEQSSSVKLFVLIQIGPGYPSRSTPLFILKLSTNGNEYTSRNSTALQMLENEVNVEVVERLNEKSDDYLLTAQLLTVMSGLDVLSEVDSIRLSGPQVTHSHLYLRTSRGRDKQYPFRFNRSTNAFEITKSAVSRRRSGQITDR
ncbi:hypothetical protein AB6A40_005358 [Gnathostoma spinigerum]|uniref:Uncharacterized protein n=1 Tax=Gnathostoma spinigerum TaxID=75299 RepID=A0ABD6EMV2_9BILA